MATSAEFWESSTYGPGDTNATYEFSNARSPNRYHLTRLLRKRGMRNYGEIISTLLTDSSPSTSASVTTTQVDHTVDLNANNFGGARTTTANETRDLTINSDKDDASANTARAVTAADVTALQTEVIPSGSRANRAPATYPTDASGNGGGGKGESI